MFGGLLKKTIICRFRLIYTHTYIYWFGLILLLKKFWNCEKFREMYNIWLLFKKQKELFDNFSNFY